MEPSSGKVYPDPIIVDADREDKEDKKVEVQKHTQYLGHAVETAKYSGAAALCVALLSMFCLTNEEGTTRKTLGDYLGNCYVILECILIVSIIAFAALKILQKAHI